MAIEEPTEGVPAEPGPEQGGGPPEALPWTIVVDGENWSADLEHGALLPCVGDRIEYIAEDGTRRMFRVREIVHTLQPSASDRPPVEHGDPGPNTVLTDRDGHTAPRALRAGLPRVFVSPEE